MPMPKSAKPIAADWRALCLIQIVCSKKNGEYPGKEAQNAYLMQFGQAPAMLQHELRLELVVNGRRVVTASRTLAALLEERELAGAKVATAVNGRFVPEAGRATTQLNAGDRVEIVSARQGG